MIEGTKVTIAPGVSHHKVDGRIEPSEGTVMGTTKSGLVEVLDHEVDRKRLIQPQFLTVHE